jgi:hypothetical protein
MQSFDAPLMVRRLLGCEPTALMPVRGGRNAAVTRVETAGGVFALKRYVRRDAARRLEMEARALTFMNAQGIADVPRLIARDDESATLAMTWLEGERAMPPQKADILACAAFVSRLRAAAQVPASRTLLDAKEACRSVAVILEQIDGRISGLAEFARSNNRLRNFLKTEIEPRRRALGDLQTKYPGDFPTHCRTLSPSDFGLHNAVRRPDGGLSIYDFEYFGWDDPAKLVADFLLHPGMQLQAPLRALFAAQMSDVFSDVPAYDARLADLLPAFRLRWALIMLNPVLEAAAESGHESDTLTSVVEYEVERVGSFLANA